MAPSDSGFGAGIFDDNLEDIEEVPRERRKEDEPEGRPSRPELPSWDEEEPEPALDGEDRDAEMPAGEEPRPHPRRRSRGRGRDRDRDRDRSPEPAEEPEPSLEPIRDQPADRGRERERAGERRGRPPRGRREGGEEERPAGSFGDTRPAGAMPAVASGVATGAGDAPAGTLVNQRVALFVDADSLDAEANERHGAKVSYRRVFSLALRGRVAVRAVAYMSEESEGSRIPFQDHLGSSGFETVRRVGSGRGAWNVRLALDAVALAGRVDALVIVSSSRELLPLLETLACLGVKVEVASFAPLDANPLATRATTFTPLGRSALYVL